MKQTPLPDLENMTEAELDAWKAEQSAIAERAAYDLANKICYLGMWLRGEVK